MESRRPGPWAKIGYSSGNLGKNVVFASLDYFQLFFLTEVWGIPPAQAGLVIFISLLWDGLAGPIVGLVIDRTSSPLGRYGPFLLIGAPFCAGAFWGVFQNPGFHENALAAWALFATVIFRTAYTICDIPHNALMSRVAVDENDAAFVSGARVLFSSSGGLLIGSAAAYVFQGKTLILISERFSQLALGASAIFVITLWISFFCTRDADQRTNLMVPEANLLVPWRAVTGNPFLGLLLAITFIQSVTLPCFAKGLAFFGAYLAGGGEWSGRAIATFTVAQAASVPVWVLASNRLGVINVLALAMSALLIGALAFLSTYGSSPARSLTLGLIGVSVGGVSICLWALLPMTMAWGEAKHSLRADALVAGLFLLMLKGGSGLGSGLLGVALQILGLGDNEAAVSANAEWIPYLMCMLPFLGGMLCLPLVWQLKRLIQRPLSA